MVHFAATVAHSCIGGAIKQQQRRQRLLIAILANHFHHLQTLSDESTRSFSNIAEREAAFLRSTLIFQHITVVTGNRKGSHRHTGVIRCFPLQRTDLLEHITVITGKGHWSPYWSATLLSFAAH